MPPSTSAVTAHRTTILRSFTIGLSLVVVIVAAGCAPGMPTDGPTSTEELAQPVPTIALPPDVVVAWSADDGLWVQAGVSPSRRMTDTVAALTATLSPDGRHVAFLSAAPDGFDLRVANVADGTVRTLASGAQLAHDVPAPADMPTGTVTRIERSYLGWLPDSTAVGFTTVADGPGDFGGWRPRNDLWLARLDGDAPTEVLTAGQGGHFVFSPDGRHAAITRRDGSTKSPNMDAVYRADIPDGEVRVLLTHATVSSGSDWQTHNVPQWTPDGAALLVAVPANLPAANDGWAEYDDPFTLLRLSLDGTPTIVAEVGPGSVPWTQYYHGYWSPDGRSVAYLAPPVVDSDAATAYPPPTTGPPTGPRTLVIAGGDGADPVPYDDVADRPVLLEWSPDGTRFVYRARTVDHGQGAPTHPLLLGARGALPRPLDGIDTSRDARVRWLDPAHVLLIAADGLTVLRLNDDGAVIGRGEVVRGAVGFGDAAWVRAR